MPELPEVETVRRGLEPVLVGQRITDAELRRDGLRWPFPPRMAERLTGCRVETLTRRSKYILAGLDSGETLLIHLGMSGRILIEGDAIAQFHHDASVLARHNHVVLTTEAGARIIFNDARRFGAMDLLETATADNHDLLRALGPEPLGNAFDDRYLAARMSGRQTPVKALLLDQRAIAGLGNIYVCESLWRAGISPRRIAGSISAKRISRLVPAIRDVLTEAIAAGGSSLRDHRRTDGALGYFQHSFAVYGRTDAPCAKTDCKGTIARIVQGRALHVLLSALPALTAPCAQDSGMMRGTSACLPLKSASIAFREDGWKMEGSSP